MFLFDPLCIPAQVAASWFSASRPGSLAEIHKHSPISAPETWPMPSKRDIGVD